MKSAQSRKDIGKALSDSASASGRSHHSELLPKLLSFCSGEVIIKAVQTLRGVVVAAILGPAHLGEWQVLMLIFSYGGWLDLGIVAGMGRSVAEHLGVRKPWVQAAGTARTAIYALWIISIPLLLLYISLSNQTWESGLRLAGVSFAVLLFHDYNLRAQLLRAHLAFHRYTFCRLVLALSECVLGIVGAWFYGITGLVATLIFAYVVVRTATAWHCRNYPRLALSFSGAKLRLLLKLGWPLFVMMVVAGMLVTVDRLFIAWFLSRQDLGLYTVALTLAACVWLVPQQAATVILQAMQLEYGTATGAHTMAQKWLWTTRLAIFITAVLCPFFLPAAYIVVRWILPQFEPALPTMFILTLGGFWLAAGVGSEALIVARRDDRFLLISQVGVIIVCALLNLAAVLAGLGLTGIAAATALTKALSAIVSLLRAQKLAAETDIRAKVLPRLIATFVVLCGLFYALELFHFNITYLRQPVYAFKAIVLTSLYVIVVFMILWRFEKTRPCVE